jgi:anti-anti-sigma factor
MPLSINVDPQVTHVSLHLEGEVDSKSAPELLDALTKIGLAELAELRIHAMQLTFMSSAGLRALVFAKQKMPHSSRLIFIGGSDDIKEVIERTGLGSAVLMVDTDSELD